MTSRIFDSFSFNANFFDKWRDFTFFEWEGGIWFHDIWPWELMPRDFWSLNIWLYQKLVFNLWSITCRVLIWFLFFLSGHEELYFRSVLQWKLMPYKFWSLHIWHFWLDFKQEFKRVVFANFLYCLKRYWKQMHYIFKKAKRL